MLSGVRADDDDDGDEWFSEIYFPSMTSLTGSKSVDKASSIISIQFSSKLQLIVRVDCSVLGYGLRSIRMNIAKNDCGVTEKYDLINLHEIVYSFKEMRHDLKIDKPSSLAKMFRIRSADTAKTVHISVSINLLFSNGTNETFMFNTFPVAALFC